MVIVQNEEDFILLKSKLPKPQIILTAGSGINKVYFEGGISTRVQSCRELGINPEHKYLVFSGRIIREKGIIELIHAFNTFTNKFADTNYRLLVVGWYNNKTFQKEVEQLIQANPLIVFLGYFKDVRNILNVTDCLILPSYYSEGVPRALTEALCMEIPVITTKNKGCMETCNLQNGFLVTPKSEDELFESIEKFSKLTNNEKNSMRLESYRLFNEKYDSNIIFSQILEEVERMFTTFHKKKHKNSVNKKEFNSDTNLSSLKKQSF
jgi:glycosyltransferase involved in cell wall biosynthesis